MSQKLKSKLLNSISSLKNDLDLANDAPGVAKEIHVSQLSRGRKAINDATSSSSIDERINILVTGLNEIIDISGNKSDKVLRQIQDLKLKIQTLEDQLQEDSGEETKEDIEESSVSKDLTDEEKKN